MYFLAFDNRNSQVEEMKEEQDDNSIDAIVSIWSKTDQAYDGVNEDSSTPRESQLMINPHIKDSLLKDT